MALMPSSPSFEQDEDRISRLPDEILCHILSYLPIKDFVRTSIFSKRWTHIWTSVPVIDIGYPVPAAFVDRVLRLNVSCLRKFSVLNCHHPPSRVREWLRAAFMRDVEELDLSFCLNDRWEDSVEFPTNIFTNQKLAILKLRDLDIISSFILNLSAAVVSLPSLKILLLNSVRFLDDDSMSNLIDGCPVLEELDIEAVHDNGKALTIRSKYLKRLKACFGCSNDIRFNMVFHTKNLELLDLEYNVHSNETDLPMCHLELPLSVFTSKKLMILKLKYWHAEQNIILSLPAAAVSLPRLKILHLRSVQFLDDNSMNNLIDGCPILEELDIEVGHDNCKQLTIRSNSLRSVRVRISYCCSIKIQFKIVIDTKNLEQLYLNYHVMVLYDVNSLSALNKVILTGGCPKCSKRIGTDVYGNHSRIVEFMRKLPHTKHMFISCEEILSPLESSQLNDLHLPVFHNLAHLKLQSVRDNWKVLSYLFERLPSLVTFDFHMANFCKQRRPYHQFDAPECLMLNLEYVKLTGFRGNADEMEMVRYLLKSATTLKKMLIKYSDRYFPRMSELSQTLLTFERGSNTCQLIFS